MLRRKTSPSRQTPCSKRLASIRATVDFPAAEGPVTRKTLTGAPRAGTRAAAARASRTRPRIVRDAPWTTLLGTEAIAPWTSSRARRDLDAELPRAAAAGGDEQQREARRGSQPHRLPRSSRPRRRGRASGLPRDRPTRPLRAAAARPPARRGGRA